MAVDIAQATRLFQSGSVVAAREICEQLLRGDPRHAAALQLLGAAHLHAKQPCQVHGLSSRAPGGV